MSRRHVLFLCTGNSCRSQMAEGWLRHLGRDDFEVASAGILAKGIDPRAAKVMSEVGIDMSTQSSKRLDGLGEFQPQLVITVCGHADAHCPVFPGDVERRHVPFDDPPQLVQGIDDDEAALAIYRRVRDEIGAFVRGFVEESSAGR